MSVGIMAVSEWVKLLTNMLAKKGCLQKEKKNIAKVHFRRCGFHYETRSQSGSTLPGLPIISISKEAAWPSG